MAKSELLRLVLRCDRFAPQRARTAVADLDAVEPVRDDAVLLASELVSSAVLEQAQQAPEHTIELVANEAPRGIRLAVAAEAEARRPRPCAMVASVLGALARRWGTECGEGRAWLWAELAL